MTALEANVTQYQAVVKKAYQAFFSPPQYKVKPKDREIIERGQSYRVPFKDGELAVTTWSEQGPTVLLMHGWGGARAQLTSLVDPLLMAGYRVIAYDQPAHGESDGKLTNLLEIAPTMELIADREGSFDAIIAHSFGTLITSYALVNRDLPFPTRLVYFGAFNRLMDSLPRFQVLAGLSDEIIDGLRDMIYETFGKDVLEEVLTDGQNLIEVWS
jgi:pimeloyl-ACP methyl ester carboxylesterase